ncbi:MAG: outer membrane lipoprotein carrier protein LolA [Nitrospirae bacterium]|nr:outer membrane lipoprotein carrier protein LolA [Nitrospirota bacterium]
MEFNRLRAALILTAFCLIIPAPVISAPDTTLTQSAQLPTQLTGTDIAASPADKARAMLHIKNLMGTIDAVSASVYQTKHLAMLKKAIETQGTVLLARPHRLRWEITNPDRSITLIDETTITIYKPLEKEADIYAIDSNIAAKQSMAFFSSTMWGDLSEMEKRFKADIYIKKGYIIYKLVPTSEMAARYLTSIVIYFNEATGTPAGFELVTPKGDRYVTSLKDVKKNPTFGTDMFNLKLPKEVWIRDHTKPDEHGR